MESKFNEDGSLNLKYYDEYYNFITESYWLDNLIYNSKKLVPNKYHNAPTNPDYVKELISHLKKLYADKPKKLVKRLDSYSKTYDKAIAKAINERIKAPANIDAEYNAKKVAKDIAVSAGISTATTIVTGSPVAGKVASVGVKVASKNPGDYCYTKRDWEKNVINPLRKCKDIVDREKKSVKINK